MQLKAFILISIIIACQASSNYIITPKSGTSGPQAALIMIQGAQISNTAYDTLMRQIQQESKMNLFIGLPGFITLNSPNPIEISHAISNTLNTLYKAGLSKSAPVFYSGHSLGSIMVQDYLQSKKINAKGLILTGGYIQRKYFWPKFTYNTPTLTLGGELDGLSRVTRITESYYIQVLKYKLNKNFPVIVAPGCNHWQFAGNGDIPFLVKQRDLKAESSQQNSWNFISSNYVDFIRQRMGLSQGQVISKNMKSTANFVEPIIKAFEQEGSKNFNAPSQAGGPLEKTTCYKGGCKDSSPWIPQVQQLIGDNIQGWTLDISNQFVALSSSPVTGDEFHLPVITSKKNSKKIGITTYAQCAWEHLDSLDTAFLPISAIEIASKLSSRQCIIITGTGVNKANVPFSVDDPQFCKLSNEKAYDYAQSITNKNTLKRFQNHGTKYTFGNDVSKQGGPFFLESHIQYNNISGSDGHKAVNILSPMQKTDIDYWINTFHKPRPSFIPDPGCFHYCKVLSPARVIEWIYVDSLRDRYHI